MAITTRIEADTPEQMRAEILRFLRHRAGKEWNKRIMTGSKAEKEAYESRALFVERLAAEIAAAEVGPIEKPYDPATPPMLGAEQEAPAA